MKKQFLFILTLCAVSLSFAQEKLMAGPFVSFPVGNFGVKDDLDGGFASPGIGVVVENQSRGSLWAKGVYFLFHLSYHSNRIDKSQLEKIFLEEIDGEEMGIGKILVNVGTYRPLVISVGSAYEVRLSEKLNLNFKGGIGAMFSNVDPIQLSVLDDGGGLLLSRVLEFRSKPSFMYLLGLRIGYRVANRTEFNFFADYSNSKLVADIKISDAPTEKSTEPISYISTGISLSFGL